MFHVTTRRGLPGELSTVELLDDRGSRAVIVPERGGIVAAFEVAGHPVLYIDDATLADPAKNVRGGIPVLFPSPGRLAGDAFARDGRAGAMKQHGFARSRAWRLGPLSFHERASATLSLTSDASTPETFAQFPWPLRLETTYALRGEVLRIEQRLENLGDEKLPYALGLHPYFRVPAELKARTKVETHATRAFDNVTKQEVALHGIRLGEGEVDLHLIDHDATSIELRWPGAKVRIHASPAYRRWVVWTLPDQDFVCVEPWTAPADALNSGSGLQYVAPRGVDEHFVEIAFEATGSARP
jgi:galactose mutarotase-like enzyme